MWISKEALFESVKKQIDYFVSQCEILEVQMNHIKLHEALHNDTYKTQKSTLH